MDTKIIEFTNQYVDGLITAEEYLGKIVMAIGDIYKDAVKAKEAADWFAATVEGA